MNLIFMGPPGSGKGTQNKFFENKYGLKSISTGDMFRAAMSEKTSVGLKAKSFIDKGELVPDNVTVDIVSERLSKNDFPNGFILDGFPRNLAQANAFDLLLKELKLQLNKVVFIDVPKEDLIKRLTGRKTCRKCNSVYNISTIGEAATLCNSCGGELYQRDDDKTEVIEKRLREYISQTLPLIDYYKKSDSLVLIDGAKTPELIFNDISRELGLK